MQEMVNFAFNEKLVRVFIRNDEPWFVGVDVCEVLELSKPENALASLDDDEKYTLTEGVFDRTNTLPEGVIGGKRGPRPKILISEPGVYRLIFRSRKPSAELFKRWIAHDVLPSLRKGAFPTSDPSDALPDREDIPDRTLLAKLYCVRECRMVHGVLRAQALWRQLGLPLVPPQPTTAIDEAYICLRHLLDAPIDSTNGSTIRETIEDALDDSENHRVQLIPFGIRVYAERDGFVLANLHPAIASIYSGTEWTRTYNRVLRRLPGTAPTGTSRFEGINRRGTFIPGDLLDETASS